MRIRSLAVVLTAASLALAGCGGSGTEAAQDPNAPLAIGVSPQPHGEILKYVDENLAPKAGIDLEIEQFDDYNRPNEAVANGELDANYYQHKPYLEEYKAQRGGEFEWVQTVHLEPLSIYSKKVGSLQELPNGARIALPNDPSNLTRGLKLLQDNGVIKLKPGAEQGAGVRDIAENPKKIEFQELSSDQLPRAVDDADAAIVNGNYALKAGLKDPLVVEKAENNPYANGLVASPAMAKDPRVQKLAELLRSPEVKDYINKTYGGISVVPAS
ncbi:MetQ/NlpA family ABC transporter substrate-binding protein [Saccharopolyspora sp. NFXS83]|uniref:MetQ/NlpA family ABC transporter substrate-binding protein n=1 Tax=Saccharopolyspora sp. NFXS83 TaxID=2993560 RepID=UPI00224AF054|nr:MetQ/NlpA family ABC transporter substrate-binding protein [Saccharopolyspora sp. NFXS83]MCX2732083.1 MetQ/NlpA family ABC transporter substrate-binding protein [Saccharopolyspora sp. NFXS83]